MHCLFIVLSCPSRNRLQKTTVAFVHFKNNSRALLCASKITNISDVKCMLKKYFYVFHIILKCHERRIFFHQMIHWDFLIFFQSFSRGVLFGIVFIFYLFFHFFLFTYLFIYFIFWCQMHDTRISVTWRKIKDELDFKGEILHILQ